MAVVLILGLPVIATALAYPENEANGDITDLVLHTEADTHASEMKHMENDALRLEDSHLENGLWEAERQDKMMQDSERLEITAKDARKANFKRNLVHVANEYKNHLWSLNNELQTCTKTHERISEQLRYSRSKLASIRGLMDQEAGAVNTVKSRYGGLAQDLRKSYETDDKRLGDLINDVNQSAVTLLSAQNKLDIEKDNAMRISAKVNASANDLISTLVSNKKKKGKLNELENAASQLNSSIVKVSRNYRKWSQALEAQKQQFKKKGKVAAENAAVDAEEVRRLVQEAASLGSELAAAESKRKSMQADLERAQALLAKDAELISRFEMKSAQIRSQAAASCKQQKDKLQVELDQNAEDLEVKLESTRAGKQALEDENQRLHDEIQALRIKAAAAQARAKEEAAEAKAQAAAEKKQAKEAAAEAKTKAVEAKAKAAAVAKAKAGDQKKLAKEAAVEAKAKAAKAKAKAAAEQARAKEAAAEAEAKAAEAKAKAAAEEARAKEEAANQAMAKAEVEATSASEKHQAVTEDQDQVVDQELEAPDSPEKGESEQNATEPEVQNSAADATRAQEEVDRAWTAEKQRKTEAVSAHAQAHDHRTRTDDVDREVAEELERRHTQHVSQEFTKMTVETMEASKASKGKKGAAKAEANKVSSWSDFVKGKATGFAAHGNPKFNKFLDMSNSY